MLNLERIRGKVPGGEMETQYLKDVCQSIAHIVHVSVTAAAITTGANTNNNTVTGAVFSCVADAVYRVWGMGRINSTADTTGVGFNFDVSSATTVIDLQHFHQLAAAGTLTGGHSISDAASEGVSSGVPATPLDVPVTMFGLIKTGATAGTAQLNFRSETTAVTELMAGFTLVVERIA